MFSKVCASACFVCTRPLVPTYGRSQSLVGES